MKFTFVGCSFTSGTGLDLEKDDDKNYVRIISNHYGADVKNVSKPGNSNYDIFMSALQELVTEPPDTLFVQWTGLNRVWLYPSPTTELFLSHIITEDFIYRDVTYSKFDLQKFSNQYHLLNHDYHNLLVLIDYCNIIKRVATNTKVVFINGLIPWTEEICNIDTINDYSKNLSAYTKTLLEFDSTDDAELNQIFTKLYTHIINTDRLCWVNMFNSMLELQVDRGNDNMHPGEESHKVYADMIINYLENN